ncbi:hypothetical protein AL053_19000 [Pseudomonas savastanoi pv. fraxini]|nr:MULTISPECIES: hypothetical protein [Pseudomonas syringae group]KWS76076.1 hypothetical protein AL053_19000 [Pseudomonas savastanoi pv. fraxini]PAB28039.1 hypothetical protein CCZ00_21245 [Pseudomonas savastanoi pv. fraxini]RMR62847.1 hypothetical protein ALP82_200027 [Pseudomonas savastanoi pv. fraxini]RMR66712.1 hypothetical protein ALP80_200022 [Pseudomonas savastanoi pv. fraxini]
MGLKSMKRPDNEQPSQEELDRRAREFIRSSPVTTQAGADAGPQKSGKLSARKPTAKRFIFSLNEDTSQQIDSVALYPRTFKASRSDVVKAGLLALLSMPDDEVIALLAQVTGTGNTNKDG